MEGLRQRNPTQLESNAFKDLIDQCVSNAKLNVSAKDLTDRYMNYLSLCNNNEDFSNIKTILASMPYLNFDNNKFSYVGIEIFNTCSFFQNLQELEFSGNNLGPNGVKSVSFLLS